MGLKRLVVNALAFGPVSKGFTGGEARRWVREVYRHKTRNYGFTHRQTNWALSHGFMPEQVERLGITEENVGDYISAKDYAYLRPLNGAYSKWITDKVTIHTVFKPFRQYMPKLYYQISKRYGETVIIPMEKDVYEASFEDVFALIKEKGEVTLAQANGISATTLAYKNGKLYFDDKAFSEEEMKEKLSQFSATLASW